MIYLNWLMGVHFNWLVTSWHEQQPAFVFFEEPPASPSPPTITMMPPKLSSHRSRLHPEQSNQWHLNLWCFCLKVECTPPKTTRWNPRITHFKRKNTFQTSIFGFQMLIFGRVTFGGDGDVPIKLLELLGPFCAPQTKCSKKIHAFTILHS